MVWSVGAEGCTRLDRAGKPSDDDPPLGLSSETQGLQKEPLALSRVISICTNVMSIELRGKDTGPRLALFNDLEQVPSHSAAVGSRKTEPRGE